MKKITVLSTLLFLFGNGLAQISPIFSYQAVVRNAANELVVSDSVDAIITFYNNTPFSSPVYSEKHLTFSNQNGLISFLVGQGHPLAGDIHSVTWEQAYARTEFLLRDGTSIADTLPITPVPYAFFAQKIPLQAIEEHLGSTNLVSKELLRDTLNQFATNEHLRDTLDQFATNGLLRDTLSQFATKELLRDTLNLFATKELLRDTLNLFATKELLRDTLNLFATKELLRDTLNLFATLTSLKDSLQNYTSNNDFNLQIQNLQNAITSLQNSQNLRSTIQEFNVTSTGLASFSLNHNPNEFFAIQMFVNGVAISTQAFSVEGNHITYYPNLNGGKPLKINDRIQFYYHY